VKSVGEETTTQQKIKKLIQRNSKLENIVNFVDNIRFIKKQNFKRGIYPFIIGQ